MMALEGLLIILKCSNSPSNEQALLSRLKHIFQNNKILIQNFSYLSTLQVINMILPLVTYPYLIRVLGSEVFGLVIYSQAVIGYFVLFVGFGLNITATREISINRDNKDKVSEIVSSVIILKGIFFLISLLVLAFFMKLFPNISKYSTLFYLTMWMCFYEFIFPVYYFQGIEKMKYITIVTLVSRIAFISFVFIFIRTKNDYLLVPITNGIGAIVAGLISFILLIKDQIKFRMQPIAKILKMLRISYIMGLAYASNSIKANFNVIIVKYLFSYSEVALYDLALKITNLGVTFLDLISQTIFPKMSREKNSNFLKKIIKLCMLISLIFIIFLYIFGKYIIILLGGLEMQSAFNILRFLAWFIPIYILGALLARNCLIVHGFDRTVLSSMVYSSILYFSVIGIFYFMGLCANLYLIIIIYLFSWLMETSYRYYQCKAKKLI